MRLHTLTRLKGENTIPHAQYVNFIGVCAATYTRHPKWCIGCKMLQKIKIKKEVQTPRLSKGNIVCVQYNILKTGVYVHTSECLPNPHRLKENRATMSFYLGGSNSNSHDILLRHQENITRGDSKSVKVKTGEKRVKYMKKNEKGPKVSRKRRMLGVSSLKQEQKKSLETNLSFLLRKLFKNAW